MKQKELVGLVRTLRAQVHVLSSVIETLMAGLEAEVPVRVNDDEPSLEPPNSEPSEAPEEEEVGTSKAGIRFKQDAAKLLRKLLERPLSSNLLSAETQIPVRRVQKILKDLGPVVVNKQIPGQQGRVYRIMPSSEAAARTRLQELEA